MNIAYFLIGAIVGVFIGLVVMVIADVIEMRRFGKSSDYDDDHINFV